MKEPARYVSLVWRLVLREAHVAMNAEEGASRIAHELRGHRRKAYVHILHQRCHWGAQFALVRAAVALEPLAFVVAAQATKERECGGHASAGVWSRPPRVLTRLASRLG